MKKSNRKKGKSDKNLTPDEESVKDEKKEYIPKHAAPHMIIPAEDMDWSMDKDLSVVKLWRECWRSDPYGSRPMQLNTELPYSTFMKAKKVIADAGLFLFKPDKSFINGKETVCWQVQNLHGSRVKSYWEKINSLHKTMNSHVETTNSHVETMNSHPREIIPSKPLLNKDFLAPSVSSQKLLRISSKDSEEFAKLNPAGESPGVPLTGAEMNNTPFLDEQELLDALEAARGGKEPAQGVIEQLRNSKYWPSFAPIAKQKGWLVEQTITPGAKQELDQRLEQLKAKNKPQHQ